MGFWWGVMIGLFAGANIGIVVAGLLAAAKREETDQVYSWDQPHMDQAVMDETPAESRGGARHLPGASADPTADF